MSPSTPFLSKFGVIQLQQWFLTIITWLMATLIFGMIAVDGYFWPAPVGIVIGIIVGTIVA